MKFILREIMFMLLVVGVIYSIVGLGVFIKQRSFMYFPPARGADISLAPVANIEEVFTQTADGLRLKNWYLPPVDADGKIMVFFHGNASDLLGASHNVDSYVAAGYGVFLVGYRGYNGNEGSPTEEGLYADGRAALEYLKGQNIDVSRIILYGQSIGTGIAARMAFECTACHALILESPYTSMAAVAQHHYWFFPANLMTLDRYDTKAIMPDISQPLFILHAQRDFVVPTPMGRELLEIALARPDNIPFDARFINGASHHTLDAPDNHAAIISFLTSLE